jgi:hypothetical protein
MMKSKTILGGVLILAAVALLLPIYLAPTWWVSLEAPNFPEEAFPDGVRINFHLNGVFNGCSKVARSEIAEEEILDCVHEMDTINHYVGMYPIAAGGPVELSFSMFLLSLVGVMLLGFLIGNPNLRTIVLAVGFIAIGIWMTLVWYVPGGLKYHNARYLEGRITVLGESAEDEKTLTPGEALIERLKASLSDGEEVGGAEAGLEGKDQSIAYLTETYDAYQQRMPGEADEWRGNGSQFVAWHYEKSLGRYFRDPERLRPMAAKIDRAGDLLFWGIIAIMLLFLLASRKTGGLFHWLMGILPMSLPLLFIIEYAAWLWWYGHNMNEMGAFSLKPFMPTVFGQGKVAQFTTNSYPQLGFWLMLIFSLLLGAAVLMRWKQAQSESE